MPRRPARLPTLRAWVVRVGAAGLPALGLACTDVPHHEAKLPALPPVLRETAAPPPAKPAQTSPTPSPPLATAAKPKQTPDLTRVRADEPAPAPEAPPALPLTAPPPGQVPVLPISLEAVMRVAEEQNPNIAVARERVCQAFAEQDVAAQKWLPDLYVGTAYYRHEGGIQLVEGPLFHASDGALFGGTEINARLDLRAYAYQKLDAARKTLQQKGELRRVTTENLLDAANTYVDLLGALSGIAIAQELDRDLEQLLTRARKLAEVQKGQGLDVQIVQLEAERTTQAQTVVRLRQQAGAAAAKLAYLLGIDPAACLQPVDGELVPLNLIPADAPCGELVEQALRNGPGVRELEGILNLIQEGVAKSQGPGRYMPVVQMQMAEGVFGAGPGASSTWDNRWDLALQVRWNLTDYLTADAKQRVTNSQVCQVKLNYQELRGRLTLGVKEARETILGSAEQLRLSDEQIRQARRARELSQLRLDRLLGGTFGEVMQAARGIAQAKGNRVNLLRDYNKAQLRLLLLLGTGPGHGKTGCAP
jgi:outer membrane protein TolC